MNEHERLLSLVVRDAKDYAPFGEDDRNAPGAKWCSDCSSGCRFYRPLEGRLGADWGVCTNPESHRVGLLTFEHQGCRHFESSAEVAYPSDW